MAECYKLLFDLSLFYTVFGYFLSLAAKTPPSVTCFLALAASILFDAFLRSRGLYQSGPRALRLLPMLLPFLALLARPSQPQLLHALPVWLYLCFSFCTDRVQTSYSEFRSHFSFGMWLLLLMVLGPIFPGRFSVSLAGAVPYLICMLACGVCLLRMLREERPDGLRQGVYMVLFILLCVLLTIGKAPQLMIRIVGYGYRYLIAPLIFAVSIGIAALFYIFYLVASWLISRTQGSTEPLKIDLQSGAEMMGLGEEYQEYTADLRWLKILLIAFAIAVFLLLLFLLFRRLLGDQPGKRAASPWREQEDETVSPLSAQRKPSFLRPRDPRMAVRWYYWRFLSECRHRGVPFTAGMTASELALLCSDAFPGADPAALTELYLPARYDLVGEISAEDARRASDLWHGLKRSIDPTDLSRKQKKRKTS